MEKIWAGRFKNQLDEKANDFNSSIRIDCRMFRQDIAGSLAHAAMLAAKGIISSDDALAITDGLGGILEDLESGALDIDYNAEDIHSFVEAELTRRIGDAGKRLHTARSRNDQVALDLRLYLLEENRELILRLKNLIDALSQKAEEHKATIMPGYTHLQRAQPITFGHHLLAYAMMFLRDIERLREGQKRLNISPLGSCALAGTTYDIDRDLTAGLLNMENITINSLDAVSDRDFCLEIAAALAMIMMHLSRFAEEIIIWSSWEFKFVELDDGFATGSSIMPQKKNPDIAELVRGKTGRVYGNLLSLLTQMKGLPLAYNKDMQEDKEAIFDSLDTVKACLALFCPMIGTMQVLKDNMRKAAEDGFLNATDCADYLVKKGLPFRTAYKITGELVAVCLEQKTILEKLPIAEYQKQSELFEEDVFAAIDLNQCLKNRISAGGSSPASVEQQLEFIRTLL
ncbi:MAG: argininosuccinate lyase [Clostridiales bacterium]|jgi:argininosuccinate lyase|nr:argininosuccinate lyase [Clostridiales bacterium]